MVTQEGQPLHVGALVFRGFQHLREIVLRRICIDSSQVGVALSLSKISSEPEFEQWQGLMSN